MSFAWDRKSWEEEFKKHKKENFRGDEYAHFLG